MRGEHTATVEELGRGASTGLRRLRHVPIPEVLVCVALVIASLAFSVKHVSGHDEISPYDEYVYIDYYARVLDDGFVRQGDQTEDFARQYISCHPNRVFGPWQPQLCAEGKRRPDPSYPMGGGTTAGLYPPLYFFSLRVMAQPLLWLDVDFVQAGRYASGMWLALAAVLLYLLLRRLKVPRVIAGSVALMSVSSIPAYWANTYISTDGPALAAGAALLLAAVEVQHRPSWGRAAVMVTLAALVSLMKIQNLEAVVVAAGFLMLLTGHDLRERQGTLKAHIGRFIGDRRTLVAVMSCAAGVLAQGVWLVLRASTSLGPDPELGVSKPLEFPLDVVRDMLVFLPGVATLGDPEIGEWSVPAARLLSLVIAGGVIGLALGRNVVFRDRALGISVLATALLAGPALSFATMVLDGNYVQPVVRYGAPLLPGMLLCFALLVRHDSRLVKILVFGLAIALYALGLSLQQ